MERLVTTTSWPVHLSRSVRPLESSSLLETDFSTGEYDGTSQQGIPSLPADDLDDGAPATARWSALPEVPTMMRGHRHRHHREEFTQELPYLNDADRRPELVSAARMATSGSTSGRAAQSGTRGYTRGSSGSSTGWEGGFLQGVGTTRSAEHDTVYFRDITSMDQDVASDSTLTATFNQTLLSMDPLTHSTNSNNPYHFVPYIISNNGTLGSNPSLNSTGDPTGLTDGGSPVNLGEEERISLIVLYTLTTLLAVLGNIVVILVFTFGKRSRTDLRIFLINLAFADLVMAIFCMPFTFTMTMLGNWIFSAPMCPIVLYMQTVSVTASVCTNMAIGIDRFWVVSFPLKSRLTKSRSRLVIAVVWIIALGLSVVQLVVGRVRSLDPEGVSGITLCEEAWPSEAWRRTYTFFILILTYLLPLSILSLTYGIVAWKLWQRTTPGNADQVRDHQQLRSKRKVIKMLCVVVLLFGICWMPLHVFFLLLDFVPAITAFMTPSKEKLLNGLYYTAHWLAMSNSFVNPIIYSFLNDSFRSDLKRLFRRWFPCCRFLPCLATGLNRESTIVVLEYSRYGGRRASSTSTGTIRIRDSSNKLISLKINGVNGRYDSTSTEVGCRNQLLNSKMRKSTERDL